MKIGFIGAGNMAKAIIGGMVKNKIYQPKEIIASRRNEGALQQLKEEYGILVTTDNKKVMEEADVVFLAVNPYDSMDKIREAKAQDGVTFPMVQDTLNLHKGFDVSAYPTTVFIDADGKIVSIHEGTFANAAAFKNAIERYL